MVVATEHHRLLAELRAPRQGVAGASITSTSRTAAATSSWNQRRNFCACTTQAAGTMAPAISRSRTAGSKSAARRAQPVEMERRAFGRGDEVGGGAGACASGNSTLRVAPSASAQRRTAAKRLGLAAAREIAAGDARCAGPRARRSVGDAGSTARRRAGRIARVGALHRVVGERQIRDRAGQRPEVVEARHEGKGARRGYSRP